MNKRGWKKQRQRIKEKKSIDSMNTTKENERKEMKKMK